VSPFRLWFSVVCRVLCSTLAEAFLVAVCHHQSRFDRSFFFSRITFRDNVVGLSPVTGSTKLVSFNIGGFNAMVGLLQSAEATMRIDLTMSAGKSKA